MNTMWHKPTEPPAIWVGDSIVVIDSATSVKTGITRLFIERLTATETGWEINGECTEVTPSDCIAWAYENDLALAVCSEVMPLGEFVKSKFVRETRPDLDGEG